MTTSYRNDVAGIQNVRLWKILVSVIALVVVIFAVAVVRSNLDNDGVAIGCPNYGITETKSSPDSRWVAEIGVEGCFQGGATSVLLRPANEPQVFGKNQRAEVFGDFPIVHLRWTENDTLIVMVPDDAQGGAKPHEWRSVRLVHEKYVPTDDEKRKHLVIGHGDVSYE